MATINRLGGSVLAIVFCLAAGCTAPETTTASAHGVDGSSLTVTVTGTPSRPDDACPMPAPALPVEEYPGTEGQMAQEVAGLRLEAGPARLRPGDVLSLRIVNGTDAPVMALGAGHAFSLHPRAGGAWYRVFAPPVSSAPVEEGEEQIIVVGDDPAFNVQLSGAVVYPDSASHWGRLQLDGEQIPPGEYLMIATVGDLRPGLAEPTALMMTTTVAICAG